VTDSGRIHRTGSICDILPAAAALLGVAGGVDRLGLVDRFGRRDTVVVVLVDGMGTQLLPELAPHAPLLAAVLAGDLGHLDELHCTFPSTTPTSLVSFGTGVQPGEHGIVGFTVNVPGTERVLTHIFWRDDPPHREWQPLPTWFERIAHSGVDARVVLPAAFAGSGLTDAAYRGARFCGLATGDDNAARVIGEARSGPGLVFGYTAVLDTAAHEYGIASPQWARAAAEVNEFLERIAAGLPADAVLLVTADHGGLDIGPAERIDIDADVRLSDGVRVVAGEPRVRYLHTEPGRAVEVAQRWRGVVGERATVLLRAEAVAAGYFGPLAERNAARIGDVVVVCHGSTVVLATAHEPKEVARLIGFHGSDSTAEMAIPLISLTAPS
jgi:hypothetical protein